MNLRSLFVVLVAALCVLCSPSHGVASAESADPIQISSSDLFDLLSSLNRQGWTEVDVITLMQNLYSDGAISGEDRALVFALRNPGTVSNFQGPEGQQLSTSIDNERVTAWLTFASNPMDFNVLLDEGPVGVRKAVFYSMFSKSNTDFAINNFANKLLPAAQQSNRENGYSPFRELLNAYFESLPSEDGNQLDKMLHKQGRNCLFFAAKKVNDHLGGSINTYYYEWLFSPYE